MLKNICEQSFTSIHYVIIAIPTFSTVTWIYTNFLCNLHVFFKYYRNKKIQIITI